MYAILLFSCLVLQEIGICVSASVYEYGRRKYPKGGEICHITLYV